ncbi:MAG: AAA family ATPase [Acidimicrobiaceae bacterium]|nr:AAA family ATPase [Acidimicrobiia bacterium]MCY4494831.1 AAA family ATPase [Acidimicrobiaceae bacterium]
MRVEHLVVKNWRNFKSADIAVHDRVFIVGPNASGKSNLLDALRFLRDVAAIGGGLQQALRTRGGIKHVRCLAARNYNKGRVALEIGLRDDEGDRWRYELHFSAERRGIHRPIVREEIVRRNEEVVLQRPDQDDEQDSELLTQTALEQVRSNRDFRVVTEFLAGIRYRHLVPQIIRDPELGKEDQQDPFGSDILVEIARTREKTRNLRLTLVNKALSSALPQLEQMVLTRDETGSPHLEARYGHWRERGAIQDERDFSDGTLRLIGLLWLLAERASKANRVLLLEEPELSLHPAIVRELPTILSRVVRTGGPQVILSTHSTDMLADEGLGLDEVVVLRPSSEGTEAQTASEIAGIDDLLKAGMNLGEIVEPYTRPEGISELPRFP